MSFSLIYPETIPPAKRGFGTVSFSSFDFISDLGLNELIAFKNSPWSSLKVLELKDFFTTDTGTIFYRAEMFTELLRNNTLVRLFETLLPTIEAFYNAQNVKDAKDDTESNLYIIREIELYIECMDKLRKALNDETLESAALKGFRQAVSTITDDKKYIILKDEVSKMTFNVNNIKSITFGANLDSNFRPMEAGIVSINNQPFSAGSLMDKLFRLGSLPDTLQCISPLIPMQRGVSQLEAVSMNGAFISALDGLLSKSIRSWKPAVTKFVLGSRRFLTDLLDEIRFILAVMKCLSELNSKGFSLCRPILASKGDEILRDMYNPLTALKMKNPGDMTYNDHAFDTSGLIYVLTGPNAGGKSVFLHGVGLAYAFLHLGLPIPASVARLCPTDGIFTHFLKKDEHLPGHSRFTEECERVSIIAKQLTDGSVFFFDESLSGTSGTEAEYIAGEVLTAFGIKGARGIFATHLHGLSQHIHEYSAHPKNQSKIDNLCADSEKANDKRSFKILRKPSDGLSHAREIAARYGLSVSEIVRG